MKGRVKPVEKKASDNSDVGLSEDHSAKKWQEVQKSQKEVLELLPHHGGA